MASKALAERQAYQPSVLLDPVAWAVAMIYGMVKPYVMTTGYEFLYIFVSQDIRWLRTRREGDTIIIDSLSQPSIDFAQLKGGVVDDAAFFPISQLIPVTGRLQASPSGAAAVTISGETPANPPETLRYGKL